MTRRMMGIGAAVIGLTTFGTNAFGAAISFRGMGRHESVQFVYNGDTISTSAGQIGIEVDGRDYNAYCVDLDHSLRNDWTASISPVTVINNGKAAAFLYDTFASTIATDRQAAALQLAIWEVVTDSSGYNLRSGGFKVNNSDSTVAQAQTFLAALPGNLTNYAPTSYIIDSTTWPKSQDLIVPEPTTAAFAGLAFLSLLRRRARRD